MMTFQKILTKSLSYSASVDGETGVMQEEAEAAGGSADSSRPRCGLRSGCAAWEAELRAQGLLSGTQSFQRREEKRRDVMTHENTLKSCLKYSVLSPTSAPGHSYIPFVSLARALSLSLSEAFLWRVYQVASGGD